MEHTPKWTMDQIAEWNIKPATDSRGDFYLIEGNKVIGKVRMASAVCYPNSSHYQRVSIRPDDDATREYFKDDPYVKATGDVYNLRYDGITGDRWIYDVEDPSTLLYLNTRIVSRLDLEWGFCHSSFKDVDMYRSYYRERNRLRIHTQHKQRRRRKTYKIRNVNKETA